MAKSVLHGNPYENLANAIVLSAVDDYRRTLRRLSKNSDSKLALADVESLERFFKSNWYAAVTSVEGEFLIRKIRAEYNSSEGKQATAEQAFAFT